MDLTGVYVINEGNCDVCEEAILRGGHLFELLYECRTLAIAGCDQK